MKAIALSLQSYSSMVAGVSREEAEMSRALEESLMDTACESGAGKKAFWGQEEENMEGGVQVS